MVGLGLWLVKMTYAVLVTRMKVRARILLLWGDPDYSGPLGQAALQMKVQKYTEHHNMQTGINITSK